MLSGRAIKGSVVHHSAPGHHAQSPQQHGWSSNPSWHSISSSASVLEPSLIPATSTRNKVPLEQPLRTCSTSCCIAEISQALAFVSNSSSSSSSSRSNITHYHRASNAADVICGAAHGSVGWGGMSMAPLKSSCCRHCLLKWLLSSFAIVCEAGAMQGSSSSTTTTTL